MGENPEEVMGREPGKRSLVGTRKRSWEGTRKMCLAVVQRSTRWPAGVGPLAQLNFTDAQLRVVRWPRRFSHDKDVSVENDIP